MPRDRGGTFEPVIVGKRQRRLADLDAVVLSLSAKGLTTGEISAHFADVYGADDSKDTITWMTDGVVDEMQAWWGRLLEAGAVAEAHVRLPSMAGSAKGRRDHSSYCRQGQRDGKPVPGQGKDRQLDCQQSETKC
jgi:hypothetical protein